MTIKLLPGLEQRNPLFFIVIMYDTKKLQNVGLEYMFVYVTSETLCCVRSACFQNKMASPMEA